MHMKRVFVLFCACAAAWAQSSSSTPKTKDETESKPGFLRRFSVGGVVRGIPFDQFYSGRSVDSTIAKPASTVNTTTTTNPTHVGVGVSLDFRVNSHIILSAALLRHAAEYTQTTKTTLTSNSQVTTATENTRITYWDVPFQARVFRVLPFQPRWLFVSGGGGLRMARHIRTGTTYQYPDNTTAYNENPTKPSHKDVGFVSGGLGLRFMDDFKIKITPEVRYTHFFSQVFNNNPTVSRTSQAEALLGISF